MELTLEEAFIKVITEYYPVNGTIRAWKHKLRNGSLKHSTMRKVLTEAGAVKVQEEMWKLDEHI